MQQTDKYKLNKPGVDDPIAIAALNENADRIEAALAAETETRQDADSALGQRVTALEAKALVTGSYTGTGAQVREFPLPATPLMVIVRTVSGSTQATTIEDSSEVPGGQAHVRILERKFTVSSAMNQTGQTYYFAAFF